MGHGRLRLADNHRGRGMGGAVMRSDGTCRSCHAPIRWAVHETTGNRMPLDPHPVSDGNVAVVEWRGAEPMALPIVAVGKAIGERSITPYRYVSHFATCPKAARHRKR